MCFWGYVFNIFFLGAWVVVVVVVVVVVRSGNNVLLIFENAEYLFTLGGYKASNSNSNSNWWGN